LGAVILHSSTPQLCVRVLNILTEEGYIRGFSKNVNKKKTGYSYCVFLKYDTNGIPVIQSMFRVSKPTRRVYLSIRSL
jgi:ribosomal protein S8